MKTLTTRIVVLAALAGIASVGYAQNAAPAAKPADATKAPAAGEPTQDTSEGALKLFITNLKAGEFNKVAELCDPGSASYAEFTDMCKQLDFSTANPKIQKAELEIVRNFFIKPWQDVEHSLVAEQGPRAQYTIKFFGMDPKTNKRTEIGTQTIDLNQFEGKWRVIATEQLLRPGQTPTPAQPQQPAPAPSDQAKPADAAPAPQKP